MHSRLVAGRRACAAERACQSAQRRLCSQLKPCSYRIRPHTMHNPGAQRCNLHQQGLVQAAGSRSVSKTARPAQQAACSVPCKPQCRRTSAAGSACVERKACRR